MATQFPDLMTKKKCYMIDVQSIHYNGVLLDVCGEKKQFIIFSLNRTLTPANL